MLRAELFLHFRFPEDYLFEDTLMTLILFPRCHCIVTIPDDIYVYRFNPVGITATAGLSPRAVESLLVTIQLMEDGAASGQKTSQLDYENFLQNEVPNTFCTIFSLHNPSVNHHVFSVCCRLLHQYYQGYTTSDPHLQPLEHALHTKDYRACMLAVMTRH